jgi:hypothetical protein
LKSEERSVSQPRLSDGSGSRKRAAILRPS